MYKIMLTKKYLKLTQNYQVDLFPKLRINKKALEYV